MLNPLIPYKTADCGSLGCQNGGSCVAPGRCSCAPGLAGDDCPRNMCPDILALNGNIVVTPVSLRVKCHKGYKLASRKDTIEAECQAGQWTVPPEDLQDDIIACLREYKTCDQKIPYKGRRERPISSRNRLNAESILL